MAKDNINLLFIDDFKSSCHNGIGTFRECFLGSLCDFQNIDITLLSFDSDVSNIETIKRYYGLEYRFPTLSEQSWLFNGFRIMKMIRRYISDDSTNIFIMNHSPAHLFIEELKKSFPLSHIIFIIHDQAWSNKLLGDICVYKEIINGFPPNGIPNEIVDLVVECFQEELRTFNIVDCVVSISDITNHCLETIYNIPNEKRRLIINGYMPFEQFDIDKNEARHLLGFSNEEELLIFAGRPVVHKGVIPLLWAANDLRHKRKKLRLVLCGSMQGFSKFNKVINHTAPSLVFAGEISHEELPLWIRAADVGIMPSYSEPFGYSALEMIDLGLPLVISDKVALCKYFRNGRNAFVATVGSDLKNMKFYVASLCDAITRALECDKRNLEAMRSYNKDILKKELSPKTMVRKYVNLMYNLVNQRK